MKQTLAVTKILPEIFIYLILLSNSTKPTYNHYSLSIWLINHTYIIGRGQLGNCSPQSSEKHFESNKKFFSC